MWGLFHLLHCLRAADTKTREKKQSHETLELPIFEHPDCSQCLSYWNAASPVELLEVNSHTEYCIPNPNFFFFEGWGRRGESFGFVKLNHGRKFAVCIGDASECSDWEKSEFCMWRVTLLAPLLYHLRMIAEWQSQWRTDQKAHVVNVKVMWFVNYIVCVFMFPPSTYRTEKWATGCGFGAS